MMLTGIVEGYVREPFANGERTIADVRSFIASNRWTFARTMPHSPHWYVVRQKCTDERAFELFIEYIRDHGQPRKYGKRTFIYLDVDGFTHWTMGDPIADTTIINRARLDKPTTVS